MTCGRQKGNEHLKLWPKLGELGVEGEISYIGIVNWKVRGRRRGLVKKRNREDKYVEGEGQSGERLWRRVAFMLGLGCDGNECGGRRMENGIG